MITLLIFGAILAAILLIASAIILNQLSRTTKKQLGIPEGKIIYSDLNKPAKAMYSKKHRLAGKPDYIIENSDGHIPIEVKTTTAGTPYQNHILQLAAYCLLIEETYNKSPPYGVIAYNNDQFKMLYNNELKNELEKTITKIRNAQKTDIIERNHNNQNRCSNCAFKETCSQKIT